MAQPRKKNAPKAFDIHRNLPTRQHPSLAPSPKLAPAPPDQQTLGRTQPVKPTPKWRRRVKWTTLSLLLLALTAFIVIAVWDARNITAATQKLFGSKDVMALLRGGNLKTASDGRVNVLLVGYSVDDPGHSGSRLTDSIILLSMDPSTRKGYMLSIPRDLYVRTPGGDYSKINAVYENYGMHALEQLVDADFQTQINYYALIDYAAVKNVVNALGGISVNIQSPDPRGLYDPNISKADGGPLRLKNGVQKIDGQTALNLTRARGDPCGCGKIGYGFPQSDFDRTQHQRQVFTAIKDELNWHLVLDPRKNSQILDAVASNVKTDVTIDAVRPLFGLFNSIPSDKLQSVSLNKLDGRNMLSGFVTFDGESALIPAAGLNDYSQIDSALARL